jgi:hypothetical protein
MQEISNSTNSINPDLASSSRQADLGLSQQKIGIQKIQEVLLGLFDSVRNVKGYFDTVASSQGQEAIKNVTVAEVTIQVIHVHETLTKPSATEMPLSSELIDQIEDGDNVLIQENEGLKTFIFKKGTEVIKKVQMSYENIEHVCKSVREQTVLETMLASINDYTLQDIMVILPDILEKIINLPYKLDINKNVQVCEPFPLSSIDIAANEDGTSESFENIDNTYQQQGDELVNEGGEDESFVKINYQPQPCEFVCDYGIDDMHSQNIQEAIESAMLGSIYKEAL